MKRPVVLLIRDGWGIGRDYEGNAVKFANTPVMDSLRASHPVSRLHAAGEPVGVRRGGQGSSEVGHLNMGAGRIVEQEILRVDKLIKSGEFFNEPLLIKAAENCKKNNSKLHLMGLVQDQGVHAVEQHLFALLEFAKLQGLKKVMIHFFSDGRDTPPRSALTYLDRLEEKIRELGVGKIASVMGRYYGMDRANNWDRTKDAYDALVGGAGFTAGNAREAIESAYSRADDPKSADNPWPLESDEFIRPTLITEDGNPIGLIEDKDSVIHFNFRQDRAIQLTRAFIDDDFAEFDRGLKKDIFYVGLTRYYDEFSAAVLPPMNMNNILGEVVSREGLWQLRISEFQKYRHVTSFFNSKRMKPFPGEDRVQVDSISIPENQQPEMSAYEVTEVILSAINNGISDMRKLASNMDKVTLEADDETKPDENRFEDTYDLIVINYANCDMVGHTGDLPAVIKAVEVVDECMGRVIDAVLARRGMVLVTADHGNCEEMIDHETGKPQTSHTLSDVEFVLASNDSGQYSLKPQGKLADITPTILELLGIPVPDEMTAETLIENIR